MDANTSPDAFVTSLRHKIASKTRMIDQLTFERDSLVQRLSQLKTRSSHAHNDKETPLLLDNQPFELSPISPYNCTTTDDSQSLSTTTRAHQIHQEIELLTLPSLHLPVSMDIQSKQSINTQQSNFTLILHSKDTLFHHLICMPNKETVDKLLPFGTKLAFFKRGTYENRPPPFSTRCARPFHLFWRHHKASSPN